MLAVTTVIVTERDTVPFFAASVKTLGRSAHR